MMLLSFSRPRRLLVGLCAIAMVAGGGALLAEPGSGGGDRVREPDGDKAAQATERADRDAGRAAERAARDQSRYVEERAKILETTASDPVRQQEELAKLEADRAEDLAKAQEEADRSAERLAEELAKAAEDAAEDAAERASEAGDYGSASELRDLAESESPDFDDRGFPVRRGEIVGLDLAPATVANLTGQGFAVVAEHPLPALGSTVFRLAAPEGLEAGAALERARAAAPDATFDYTHYYGMQYAATGKAAGAGAGTAATLPREKGKLTIGMIDTGVVSHPSLKGVSIQSKSFATGKGAAPADHGTAVASILASEGTSKIYSASIFRGTSTKPFTSADAIVDALNWMVSLKVPVVNMSLSGPRNAILDKLVSQAIGRGTLIVAAAGNGGPSAPPAYPAALGPVVAVTAVDKSHKVYRYANQGKYITVAALGVGQPAANAKGGISTYDGTSFATPHIAAWMARCMKGKETAESCARKLRKAAKDLGAPGFDPVYGHGLVE